MKKRPPRVGWLAPCVAHSSPSANAVKVRRPDRAASSAMSRSVRPLLATNSCQPNSRRRLMRASRCAGSNARGASSDEAEQPRYQASSFAELRDLIQEIR